MTAVRDESGWKCESEFIELGPIQWRKAEIGLEGVKSLNAADERISGALRSAANAARESKGVIISAALTGRTSLDAQLRRRQGELAAYAEEAAPVEPKVWMRELRVETAPETSAAANIDRDDLLGEVARIACRLASSDAELEAMARKCLKPLNDKLRQLGKPMRESAEDLKETLREAQRICQDALEGR